MNWKSTLPRKAALYWRSPDSAGQRSAPDAGGIQVAPVWLVLFVAEAVRVGAWGQELTLEEPAASSEVVGGEGPLNEAKEDYLER